MSTRTLEYGVPEQKARESLLLNGLLEASDEKFELVDNKYQFEFPIGAIDVLSDIPNSQVKEVLDSIFTDKPRPSFLDLEQYFQVVSYFGFPELEKQLTTEFIDLLYEGKINKLHGYRFPLISLKDRSIKLPKLLEICDNLENFVNLTSIVHVKVTSKELCVLKQINDDWLGFREFFNIKLLNKEWVINILGSIRHLVVQNKKFKENITITSDNFRDYSLLLMFPTITSLVLDNVAISDLQPLEKFQNLSKLTLGLRLVDLSRDINNNNQYFSPLDRCKKLSSLILTIYSSSLDTDTDENTSQLIFENLSTINSFSNLTSLKFILPPNVLKINSKNILSFRKFLHLLSSIKILHLGFTSTINNDNFSEIAKEFNSSQPDILAHSLSFLLPTSMPQLEELSIIINFGVSAIRAQKLYSKILSLHMVELPPANYPKLKSLKLQTSANGDVNIIDIEKICPSLESLKILTNSLKTGTIQNKTLFRAELPLTLKELSLNLMSGNSSGLLTKLIAPLVNLHTLIIIFVGGRSNPFKWINIFNQNLDTPLYSVTTLKTNIILNSKLFRYFPNLRSLKTYELKVLNNASNQDRFSPIIFDLEDLKSHRYLKSLIVNDKTVVVSKNTNIRRIPESVPVHLFESELGALRKLEVLKINNVIFSDETPLDLSNCQHLRNVNLVMDNVLDGKYIPLLEALSDVPITELKININIDTFDILIKSLEAIAKLNQLEKLKVIIQTSIIVNIHCGFFSPLQQLKEFSIKIMDTQAYPSAVLFNTDEFNYLPKLEVLNISANIDEDLYIDSSALQVLTIRNNTRSNANEVILEKLPSLKSLRLMDSYKHIILKEEYPLLRYMSLRFKDQKAIAPSIESELSLPKIESVNISFSYTVETAEDSWDDFLRKIFEAQKLQISATTRPISGLELNYLSSMEKLRSLKITNFAFRRRNLPTIDYPNVTELVINNLPPNLTNFTVIGRTPASYNFESLISLKYLNVLTLSEQYDTQPIFYSPEYQKMPCPFTIRLEGRL